MVRAAAVACLAQRDAVLRGAASCGLHAACHAVPSANRGMSALSGGAHVSDDDLRAPCFLVVRVFSGAGH